MTIWLMNHYASTMFFDKAGRHYWFAKKLEERGHKVTVFCASTLLNRTQTVDTAGRRWTVKETDGTPFVFVRTPPTFGNGLDRIKNMIRFYFGLFPAAKGYARQNGKPDVIVASSVHPLTMVAGIRIAKRWKIPCVCEIRDLWPEAIFSFGKTKPTSLLGRILTAGEHWIYKKAQALIFTKEGDTDYLIEKGWTTRQGGDVDLTKCYYINNGVNLSSFTEQSRTEVFDDPDLVGDNHFNVVYTGTIRPVNNVGNLLDCAAILKARGGYDDVRFLIYGDGSERATLEERLKKEGLDTVKLKGFIERKYIPFILSKSAVNVLNYSQNEYNWTRGNSSNKLFEYMASGKPVISTVRMGYSIINAYCCGVELEACTPACLADAIIRFHDMSAAEYEQMGCRARQGAQDFDFDTLTDKLMQVIESVSG